MSRRVGYGTVREVSRYPMHLSYNLCMNLIDQVRAARRLPTPAVAREIRISAGVSQQQIADELKVHRLTVVRWEAGTSQPTGTHRAVYTDLLESLQQELAS